MQLGLNFRWKHGYRNQRHSDSRHITNDLHNSGFRRGYSKGYLLYTVMIGDLRLRAVNRRKREKLAAKKDQKA